MSKVRYKIRREQLERVVEHFVMESAMIEKNAAKKHKMSMGAEQSDDMGDGMEAAKEIKKPKMKQAPEVKKHIHGKVNESMGSNVSATEALEDVDPRLLQMVAKKLKGTTEEEIEDAIEDAATMDEAKSGKLLGIGGTLFVLGLTGLGIEASLAEKLASSLADDVTLNMLNNVAWVASAISTLAGTVTTTLGVKKGFDERKQEWMDKAMSDGFTEKGEDKLGRLTMTNPDNNRVRIYRS